MYGGTGSGLRSPRRHVFGAGGCPSAGSILKRRDKDPGEQAEARLRAGLLTWPSLISGLWTAPRKRERSYPLVSPLPINKDCEPHFDPCRRSFFPRPQSAVWESGICTSRPLCPGFSGRLRFSKGLGMALNRVLHPVTLAAGRRRASGSLAEGCLADRRLWDRLHAQVRPGGAATFDWFFGYEEAQGLLLPLLQEGRAGQPPPRVLDVGCGTSSLCTGLYTKCPHPVEVLGVDFSPVAVAHMNSLLEGCPGRPPLCPAHPASSLRFRQADAQNLGPAAPSGSFQLVLDKGTWDAVARGGLPGAGRLLSECLRVLSPRGTLIQFSDEDPDVRLPCLERGSPGCAVTVQELGPFRGLAYFAYLVQRSH
ncbi:citrate synthase-lysine N-methyltransferase CSKMT, mitochondrial [Tenrec ecaudatus]|uniref:citrate synthase-lysine N-methyltransferase CSKMT, mitochondrial n=1 Tax=Tenrec ecaudatus TaxID=94439 RepID=UPI003F5AB6C9